MRSFSLKDSMTAMVALAASVLMIAVLAWPAGAASSSGGRAFSGDICSLLSAGQLAAAEVSGGCVQPKTSSKALITYTAHWGENGNAAHWLMVTIMKPQVNAEVFYAAYQNNASRNRAPIKLGSWAYWKTERYNGDRRRGDIIFRVGDYVCFITLNDDNGAPDEMGIANALFSIAKTIAAKLG